MVTHSTSRYLTCNPESYDVLAVLYPNVQGQYFADILAACDISMSRLHSVLNHLKQYSLVETARPQKYREPMSWRIPVKSRPQVAGILTLRDPINGVKSASAGA